MRVSIIPDHSLSASYAWICPSGKFYGCQHMEHLELAVLLLKKLYDIDCVTNCDYRLEKLGWLKITSDSLTFRKVVFFHIIPATQSQINTIFDWCELHNYSMPELHDTDF